MPLKTNGTVWKRGDGGDDGRRHDDEIWMIYYGGKLWMNLCGG